MYKSQKNYQRAFKEAEAAALKYDKAEKNMDLSRAELERTKTNAMVRAQASEEAKQSYALCLQNANQRQDAHYSHELPTILEVQTKTVFSFQYMKIELQTGNLFVAYSSSECKIFPVQ